MALLGLLVYICGGGTLFRGRLPQRGAGRPLHLRSTILELDVRGERGRGGGGGGLQETAVVEEAKDTATLLSKGIEDKTVL